MPLSLLLVIGTLYLDIRSLDDAEMRNLMNLETDKPHHCVTDLWPRMYTLLEKHMRTDNHVTLYEIKWML